MPDYIDGFIADTNPHLSPDPFSGLAVVSLTLLPFLESDINRSIADRFTHVAAQLPDLPAVKSGETAWTYSDLGRTASKVAQAIQAITATEPEPIALLVNIDAPAIAAILGVFMSGNFYSALDHNYPPAYLSGIMELLEARVLLVDRPNLELAKKLVPPGCNLILFEDTQTLSGEYLVKDVPSSTPAGIFFTSGSTGSPKGVIRSQQSALQRVWLDRQILDTYIADRQSLFTSFCFTSSNLDLMKALMNGCALCVYDLREHTPAELSRWLQLEAITSFHPPVAYLRHFLNNLGEDEFFPSVRVVSLGGDFLFKSDLEKARDRFPVDCEFIYQFASSEVSTITRNKITSKTHLFEHIVPVGRVAASREVSILDSEGQPVPAGEVGLIAVRSRYLATGYWKNPEETARRFLVDPVDPEVRTFISGDLGRFRPDGTLEFLGREDFMVKVRGYRVELASVEAAILSCEGVRDVVVVARSGETIDPEFAAETSNPGADSLVAYIEVRTAEQANPEDIRRMIAQQLPDYMLPTLYVFLDILPRLANGKVNRGALPDPIQAGSSSTKSPKIKKEPGAPSAGDILSIVRSATGAAALGEQDDFFTHGCNSLLAAQIVNSINQMYTPELPLRVFYEYPRASLLAAWFQVQASSPTGDEPPTGRLDGPDSDMRDYLSQFG